MKKNLLYCLFLFYLVLCLSSVACSKKTNKTPEIKATEITLKKTNLFLRVGNKVKLEIEETPKGGHFDLIQWVSSNNFVASVDEGGYVQANSRGEAVISLITNLGSTECNVKVDFVPISSFSIKQKELVLTQGDSYQLEVSLEPKDILQYSPLITYSSNRTDIVEVNESGLIIAKKAGAATITATVQDVAESDFLRGSILQEVSDECTVVVNEKPEVKKPEVKFLGLRTDIELGTSVNFKIAYDDELQNIGFDFISTNESIVTINEQGIITGIGIGQATVIVRAKDNSCEDRATIAVKPFYDFFRIVTTIKTMEVNQNWITKESTEKVSYNAKKKIYISHIDIFSDEDQSGSALMRGRIPITLTMPNGGDSFEFHLNYVKLHDPFLRIYVYDKDTCYVLRKPEATSSLYFEYQYPSDTMSDLFD